MSELSRLRGEPGACLFGMQPDDFAVEEELADWYLNFHRVTGKKHSRIDQQPAAAVANVFNQQDRLIL